MSYTKSQLEAVVQTLSEVLEAFDVIYFEQMVHKPEWANRHRRALYNNLVATRKALAEVEDEPSPYAPSEDYLNALRSFGLTNEQCVEELRSARACDFELLLADEKRKAYDQGLADGKTIGFANGFDEGYDVCANDHDLVLNTGRTMRGSDEYNAAMVRATNYSPDKI